MGNNTILDGGDGDDVLNGGDGIDTMNGGLGNDTYYVDNVGDVTTETGALATEIDTVVCPVSRTPGVNIERPDPRRFSGEWYGEYSEQHPDRQCGGQHPSACW